MSHRCPCNNVLLWGRSRRWRSGGRHLGFSKFVWRKLLGFTWISNKSYMTYISHRNPWDDCLVYLPTWMNGFWLCFMAVDVGNYTIHGASGLYTRLKVVTWLSHDFHILDDLQNGFIYGWLPQNGWWFLTYRLPKQKGSWCSSCFHAIVNFIHFAQRKNRDSIQMAGWFTTLTADVKNPWNSRNTWNP